MPFTTRRIPLPVEEENIVGGDFVVLTDSDRSELALVIVLGNSRIHFLALGTLAGAEHPEGVPRMTTGSRFMGKVAEVLFARPLSNKAIAVEGDPAAGALTMAADGQVFVRVEMHGQVGYINMATGLLGEPALPRAFYPQWALAVEGDQERIIFSFGGPRPKK